MDPHLDCLTLTDSLCDCAAIEFVRVPELKPITRPEKVTYINVQDLGEQVWSLSVGDKHAAVGLKSGAVVLFETAAWSENTRTKLGSEVRSLVLSADGKALFASSGGNVHKLSVPDMKTEATRNLGGTVRAVAPAVGSTLAAADGKGQIHILTYEELARAKMWKAHSNMITALAQTAGGSVLASSSMDGTVCFWDVSDGKELGSLKNAGWLVRELAVNESGILAVSETGGFITWRPE